MGNFMTVPMPDIPAQVQLIGLPRHNSVIIQLFWLWPSRRRHSHWATSPDIYILWARGFEDQVINAVMRCDQAQKQFRRGWKYDVDSQLKRIPQEKLEKNTKTLAYLRKYKDGLDGCFRVVSQGIRKGLLYSRRRSGRQSILSGIASIPYL